jgi:hypothetical protein
MEQDGNDYPLASKLKHPSKAIAVNGWKDTWEKLKEYA